MNKIILIGRLTRDVEMRYGTNNNNTAIARYTLAVNRPYRQDGGPEADFLPCLLALAHSLFAERAFRKHLPGGDDPASP